MANRRMFSREITDSDDFADMPLSAQALYFHLGMAADDDGFVNSPNKLQRSIGASNDDLTLLMAKNFILKFESGVIVIKHWRINNSLRSDRKKSTKYTEEFKMLCVKKNGAYTLENQPSDQGGYQLPTNCQPTANQMTAQYSIVEDSIVEKDILSSKTLDIIDYLNSQTGKNFKSTTRATVRHIHARLNEGFDVDDFKKVIDTKVADWKDDKAMAKYLRPETLFGSKFDGYLNEGGGKVDYSKYDFK